MDTDQVISLLKEFTYMISVFAGLLLFISIKGTRYVINLILGLYFALLLSLKFPYYGTLLNSAGGDAQTEAVFMIGMFSVFSVISILFFNRMMPPDNAEGLFEDFGRKILYALAGTVLVMIFSYHVLPITEFIEPGSPIAWLFASDQSFFFWLLVPLLILFLL